MKPKAWCLGILLGLGVAAMWAGSPRTAPGTAPQQRMTVVVVNAHLDPARPVERVRVSLTYLDDSSTPITLSPGVTNREGAAALSVPLEAAQRGNLRIEITGAADLVVYQPADGQLAGLPASLTIRLLPKGSLLLLGDAQIEKMLHRLLLQNNAKSQEIRALKGKLALADSQKAELAAAMTEWANANGFAVADVDKQVRQWADDIQSRKDQATDEQKALAEFALKHYGVAAQTFEKLFDARRQASNEREKRYLEERRSDLRESIDASRQAANSYQLNSQYHQATQVLEEARDDAAEARRRYPEDGALRGIWLNSVRQAADARRQEGEVGPAVDSLPLMARSVEDYRNLLHELTSPAERREWATTQNSLGLALLEQGKRSKGEQARESLAQAVKAFEQALQAIERASPQQRFSLLVSTIPLHAKAPAAAKVQDDSGLMVRGKTDWAQDWAAIQNNLGLALAEQGKRAEGEGATELLSQAVEAYRAALEVRTRAELPQDWAATQNNLGNALGDQADRSSGKRATELFAQAVEAFRAALQVQTKADLPQDWALAETNLAIVLVNQGEQTSGPRATELFAQAVQAYRAALEVRTKADVPQDWAMNENNLGIALEVQGARSDGAQATALLAQAVQAFRAALEVHTRADLPQLWAMTENNLGNSLQEQGDRSGGEAAAELFAQSAEAYRSALEIWTKAELPQDWAMAENNLGGTLLRLGERSSGQRSTDFLAQSVQAYRSALEVWTKADLPQGWANSQNNLGDALSSQAEHSSRDRAIELLAQSVQAYHAALEVRTKADQPIDWAATQSNLADTLHDEARLATGEKAAALLEQAIAACRSALEVFTQADSPQEWAQTQIVLGSVLADHGDSTAAVTAIEAGLAAAPDDVNHLQSAVSAYSNRLYRFDRAYELSGRWLKVDPSPDVRLNYVEANLATARFEDCVRQAASIDDSSLSSAATSMILIRDTLAMTCKWGAGQKSNARQAEDALVSKAASLKKTDWVFAGTRRFIASSPAFETGRASWIALFQSLEDGDGAAMTGALRQLEKVLSH